MTGLLASGEADVAFGMAAHCCDRYLVHDISQTLYTRSFIVLFRQPKMAKDIYVPLFRYVKVF